jgi:[ribosomal protein S5]-alanine N-acetyltransferase
MGARIIKGASNTMTLRNDTASIATDRLYLRRIDASDLEFLTRIHADPDVARYLGNGSPRSATSTESWFGDVQNSYANAQLGQLAVIRKADGVRLGRCGLSDAVIESAATPGRLRHGWFFSAHAPIGVDLEQIPELGYTFDRAHWGQGYASEAASCVYEYAKKSLTFGKIMSVIHADNAASRAVAQKFGAYYVDVVELMGRPFDRYHWPLV